MVQSDRALASSYRLSIVTMPLTEAVWPQFAMQVFGVQSELSFGDMRPVVGKSGSVEPYLLL